MKSKKFTILFRVLVILTFFAGMVYLITFVLLAGVSRNIAPDSFLEQCRRWIYIFFVYMILCICSTVFSVLSVRKAEKKLLGIIRTAVLGAAAVADILAVRYVAVFSGYEDAAEASKALDELNKTGTVFIVLSFVGTMLLFFLFVSSIYYIVTAAKESELDAVLEPSPAGKKNTKQ